MLTQLRDIQGLDSIPWWPLATGWWLVAALAAGLVFVLVSLVRNLLRYPAGSWRRPAWKQLRTLRQRAARMPAQQVAVELSELLRRIAIARVGREQAAGLAGKRWLAWLQEHDPAGFDWIHNGRPLLTLPYAPADSAQENARQLLVLIDAALPWVQRRGRRQHA